MRRLASLLVPSLLAGTFVFASPVAATTYVPRNDLSIIALGLRSGQLLWEYKPQRLSDAHFEVHAQGVVAFPHYSQADRSGPSFLDPSTGLLRKAFGLDPKQARARSATFYPLPPIVLSNGWRLTGFRPGYNQALSFADRSGRTRWTITTPGYPHSVAAWRDVVFWAYSYLSKDGILHARRAGSQQPLWTVDLNALVPAPPAAKRYHGRIRAYPLTRMHLQVLGDRLYVEANEHIFAFAPAGARGAKPKLLWQRNLARELKLSYYPDFFGGALNLAVFAEARGVLVVAFERRVVAMDLRHPKKRVLWHLAPDTFPHCPFPVIAGDRVIFTAGPRHKLTRP